MAYSLHVHTNDSRITRSMCSKVIKRHAVALAVKAYFKTKREGLSNGCLGLGQGHKHRFPRLPRDLKLFFVRPVVYRSQDTQHMEVKSQKYLVRSATAKSDPFWGSRAGGGGECNCSPGQLRYPSRAPGTLRDRPPQLITRPRMTASRYLASQLDSHLAAQIALRAKRSTYINKQTHKEITHQPTNQPTNHAHKYTQNQKTHKHTDKRKEDRFAAGSSTTELG